MYVIIFRDSQSQKRGRQPLNLSNIDNNPSVTEQISTISDNLANVEVQDTNESKKI